MLTMATYHGPYDPWNGWNTDAVAATLWGDILESLGVYENAYGVPFVMSAYGVPLDLDTVMSANGVPLDLDTDASGKNRGPPGIRTAKTSHLRFRSDPK